MRVDVTMRAPDAGEVVRLVAMDADGNVDHIGITDRDTLRRIRPMLERIIARVPDNGYEDGAELIAIESLLSALRDA